MRYRSFTDRKISAYGAILIITIVGAGVTILIIHTIASIDFTYVSQTAALGY